MRALVTGGGRRVGRAICLELAKHGYDVAVHYHHSADPARQVAEGCGPGAWTVQADLATVEGCQAVCDAVAERWESLDLLVNNASVFYPVPFEDLDAAEWDSVLATNLRAPFLLSRGLLPLLRKGKDPVVVHLCDIGADRPVRGHAHYSVSKAGLVMLVKAMAVELAPALRTVGVSPGQVAWPESYDAEKRARLTRRIPLGRAGEPDDVARLVRFLALEGTYLNGVVVPVDGGLSVRY